MADTTAWVAGIHCDLFLTVLEPASPISGCQHGPVRALFWVTVFCVLTWQKRRRELSGVSSVRARIPIMAIQPSLTKLLPRDPTFQYNHLGDWDFHL